MLKKSKVGKSRKFLKVEFNNVDSLKCRIIELFYVNLIPGNCRTNERTFFGYPSHYNGILTALVGTWTVSGHDF